MESPTLHLIYPPELGESLPASESEERLSQLCAYPPAASTGPWVRANMISTIDGSAQGPNGLSGTINGPADHRLFAALRALADVVLVGAGTARAEGYRDLDTPGPLVAGRLARGQTANPALAVVTASGLLPAELLDIDPIVITTSASPRLTSLRQRLGEDHVIVAGTDRVEMRPAIASLAARGWRRILTEGGPSLLTDLVRADALDDIFVTTAPLMAGGAGARIASDHFWFGRKMRLAQVFTGDQMILTHWLREMAA